MTIQEKKAKRV